MNKHSVRSGTTRFNTSTLLWSVPTWFGLSSVRPGMTQQSRASCPHLFDGVDRPGRLTSFGIVWTRLYRCGVAWHRWNNVSINITPQEKLFGVRSSELEDKASGDGHSPVHILSIILATHCWSRDELHLEMDHSKTPSVKKVMENITLLASVLWTRLRKHKHS